MEIHGGEPPPFEDGLPLLRAFIVPADRAVFKGNWDVMGLCGTGSFDYEIPEQFADSGMTFSIFETQPRSGGALYGLGPVPLGTISSVAWALGVANRTLCEVVEIVKAGRMRMGSAPQREQQIFQRDLGIHTVALKAAPFTRSRVLRRCGRDGEDEARSGAPAFLATPQRGATRSMASS